MTSYDFYLKGYAFGVLATYIPDFPDSASNRSFGIGLKDQRQRVKRTLQELECCQDWIEQVLENKTLQSMKLRTVVNKEGCYYDIYLYWDGQVITFNACLEGETRPVGSYIDAQYLCDIKGLKESDFYYIRIK